MESFFSCVNIKTLLLFYGYASRRNNGNAGDADVADERGFLVA
jgi:hypothetical protein